MTARQYRGSDVSVAVYDLSPANNCLATVGFGLFHTGVRVGGREYTFSNDGVFNHSPGEGMGNDVKLREVISLGELTIDSRAVNGAISDLKTSRFASGSYHLIHKNCNHFSEAFLARLGLKVPAHINRLAWVGSFWPWWGPMGGDGSGPASRAGSTAVLTPSYAAFSGSGQSLGGGAGGTGTAAANSAAGRAGSAAGPVSRREQMAAAAAARMTRLAEAQSGGKKDL